MIYISSPPDQNLSAQHKLPTFIEDTEEDNQIISPVSLVITTDTPAQVPTRQTPSCSPRLSWQDKGVASSILTAHQPAVRPAEWAEPQLMLPLVIETTPIESVPAGSASSRETATAWGSSSNSTNLPSPRGHHHISSPILTISSHPSLERSMHRPLTSPGQYQYLRLFSEVMAENIVHCAVNESQQMIPLSDGRDTGLSSVVEQTGRCVSLCSYAVMGMKLLATAIAPLFCF